MLLRLTLFGIAISAALAAGDQGSGDPTSTETGQLREALAVQQKQLQAQQQQIEVLKALIEKQSGSSPARSAQAGSRLTISNAVAIPGPGGTTISWVANARSGAIHAGGNAAVCPQRFSDRGAGAAARVVPPSPEKRHYDRNISDTRGSSCA